MAPSPATGGSRILNSNPTVHHFITIHEFSVENHVSHLSLSVRWFIYSKEARVGWIKKNSFFMRRGCAIFDYRDPAFLMACSIVHCLVSKNIINFGVYFIQPLEN